MIEFLIFTSFIILWLKICFYCGSEHIKKNGIFREKQRYLCNVCGKQFIYRKQLDVSKLYDDYLYGKQTILQLSIKYQVSTKTISRKLDTVRSTRIISSKKDVVLLTDATYWGRNFGVIVMKDSRTKRVLWRKFIYKKESLLDYQEGLDWLLLKGFKVEGVVCDGLRGVFNIFSKYRVQMCQFHQLQIVQRHLTLRPELPASQELLSIAKFMFKTDKESFEGIFSEWIDKWSDFLKERTVDNKTGKSHYTHKRLRSTYLSIKRNMPYLWTWYENIEIGIPNTNNGLEGQFSDLKTKLRNHNGLKRSRKMVFIDEYFKRKFHH